MEKSKKSKHFIKKPIYEGGNSAMSDFFKKHMSYPQEALDKKQEGTVQVSYEIDWKGNVSKAKVMNKLGYGLDEEAVRLVKLLKFKIPKEPYKAKVKFGKKTNIHFRIPSTKPQPQSLNSTTQYQYSLTSKSQKEDKVKEKKNKNNNKNNNNNYSYTIKINA